MPFRTPVFKAGAFPFLRQDGKNKIYQKSIKETGLVRFELTWYSSQSAGPYRLATAQYFFGNALFRPVSSQICRFKRYPMLSHTLPNRHGVSQTPIFGFGDRHATINTTRLHIFNYLFQYLNQHLQLVLIIHNRPSIVFRSCKLPFSGLSYLFSIVNQAGFPCKVAPITIWFIFLSFLFFLLYIFFQFFNQFTYLDLVYTTGSPSLLTTGLQPYLYLYADWP